MNTRAVDNFDQHINGQWKRDNVIPDDQVRWGSFIILNEENLVRMRKICETDCGLVGQLYRKSLNYPTDISPDALNLLQQINAVTDSNEYLRMSAKLLTQGLATLIHICKSADDKDPEWQVPTINDVGLGLPDRDFYTRDPELHEDYKIYLREICELFGYCIDSEAVFEYETKLAQLHLTRTQLRDSEGIYHKIQWTEIRGWLPEFFDHLGLPLTMTYGIVHNPQFVRGVAELVAVTPAETLRHHLLAQTCTFLASNQTESIVERHFDFHCRRLAGQKALLPAWKRAIRKVRYLIDDQLGQLYVQNYFPIERKKECESMVGLLFNALESKLMDNPWMSAETKQAAIQKLQNTSVKIGYPTKWHSIEGLWPQGISDLDLTGILLEWGRWDWQEQECAKFYTRVDKELWQMRAQEVNACYSPTQNEIIFPAGILQKPFYGFDQLAQNLGAIGVVIGHEMTHGFDDQGRKYNANGELVEWWSPEDSQRYEQLALVVEEHYGNLEYAGGRVNGKLTLGENIADIGGLKLALLALKLGLGRIPSQSELEAFFSAYATIWRLLITKEYAVKLLLCDPHAPCELRVNAALAHIPEFYQTYGVQPGDGMYLDPEKRMTIW